MYTSALLIAFGIYFCILTAIGIIFYHRNKNSKDFMLGDRSTNYWVTAIAAQASDMSSWLFLAFPAAIYARGMIEIWTAAGLIFFMFLNWHFIAPKIRVATEHYNSLTISSFLSSRFDNSGIIRFLVAFISLIFFTFYISSGLVGMGRIFEGTFNISYFSGIIIGLMAALIYTIVGGFFAVAWCNLFQGIFMLFMLLLVPLYTYFLVGGSSSILAAAHAKNISLNLFPSSYSIAQSLILVGGWGLGYFGQPHILIYFMGIDDPKKIRYAKYIGILWMIIALAAAAAVGFIGLAYFANGISNPELIFVKIAKDLFAPFIAGFILCGIFAATLSTMNSHILISGSIMAEDVYKKFLHPHASSKTVMAIARLSILIISLIALLIAMKNTNTIYDLVNYAWAGLGSAFGPLIIASLYVPWITWQGACAGILVGAFTAGFWPYTGICICH
jgi:sodium/proline symporter